MSTRARLTLGYGVASVLVVAGAVLAVIAKRTTEFGWYAYSPLSEDLPVPRWPWPSGWRGVASAALVGAGLLVAAGTTGWLIGRRSGPRLGRVLRAVLAAAGATLVVLGGVLLRLGAREAEGATVAITRAPPGPPQLARWFWVPEQMIGTGMVALGLLLAVAALASLSGRRVRRPERRSAAAPPPAPADRG